MKLYGSERPDETRTTTTTTPTTIMTTLVSPIGDTKMLFSPNANSFSNSCLSIPPIVTTTIAIENYVHHCTISFEDGEDDDGTRDNVQSRNPSATHLLLEAYAPS